MSNANKKYKPLFRQWLANKMASPCFGNTWHGPKQRNCVYKFLQPTVLQAWYSISEGRRRRTTANCSKNSSRHAAEAISHPGGRWLATTTWMRSSLAPGTGAANVKPAMIPNLVLAAWTNLSATSETTKPESFNFQCKSMVFGHVYVHAARDPKHVKDQVPQVLPDLRSQFKASVAVVPLALSTFWVSPLPPAASASETANVRAHSCYLGLWGSGLTPCDNMM